VATAKAAGADHHLAKPITAAALYAAIGAAMAGAIPSPLVGEGDERRLA
jgi:CheY-like chemotaxis protein